MSRRSTPPPEQNHNLEDDDDGADDGDKRVSNASVNFRVPAEIKHVLQTIFQNAGSTETSVLDMLDLSKLDWKSSAGAVIGSLLGFADLQWSADGKRVWRRGNEDDVIEWATGDRRASLRPASRTASAREEAQAASSAHDAAQVKIKGSAAQRRGAEAAKVAPMRTLPTATPTAALATPISNGSGWGNIARPLARRCLVEQAALDSLAALTQEHRALYSVGLDEERGSRGATRDSDSRDNLYNTTTHGVTRDARILMRMYIGRIGTWSLEWVGGSRDRVREGGHVGCNRCRG